MSETGHAHQLSELPADARALFACAARRSLFYSAAWFELFEQQVGAKNGETLYLYHRTAQATDVVVPLWQAHARGRFYQPRRLCALSNYYTTFYSPLLGPTADAGLRACAAWLRERAQWDVLELMPLCQGEAALPALEQAFGAEGYAVSRYHCFGNWFQRTEGVSYEQYLAERPSKLKETLRRRANKLSKEKTHRYVLITDERGLEQAIADYQAIYAKSWKQPEPFPEFMPALMRLAAREGWLRLGLLYVEEQAAAAQLWLINGGLASIYKLAYDPQFKQYSVGSLLTAHLMRHILDVDKAQEVDYLTGDDAYKRDWMSERRACFGLQLINRHTWRGRLLLARNSLARQIRRLQAARGGQHQERRGEDRAL